MTSDDITGISNLLELDPVSVKNQIGDFWYPNRVLLNGPPSDPVLYRLYEVRIKESCGPFLYPIASMNT